MYNVLQYILKRLAQRIIKKYQPLIVAITGSIGKTTTKHFIAQIIRSKYLVLETFKNYNTEIGVPLTILRLQAPNKSWKWPITIWHGIYNSYFKNFPYQILVLEMGADRPGDIDYLTNLVQPDYSVITNIEAVHLGKFGNIENIFNEKSKLGLKTKNNGKVFLNKDHELTPQLTKIIPTHKLRTYGLNNKANYQARKITSSLKGLSGELIINNDHLIFEAPYIIGRHFIYGILASFAIAHELGIANSEIIRAIQKMKIPVMRLVLKKGKNKNLILDASYNASEKSVQANIQELVNLKSPLPKKAILGDLAELGNLTINIHRSLGEFLAKQPIQELFLIGQEMQTTYNELCHHKVKFKYSYYPTLDIFLKNIPKDPALYLIQASNCMKFGKIIKKLIHGS